MKFAYGYRRTSEQLAHIGADRVFIDGRDPKRPALTRLIGEHLRQGHGDQVVIASPGDIRANSSHRRMIEGMGVEIVVTPPPAPPRERAGPKRKVLDKTYTQVEAIWRNMLYSTAGAEHEASKVNIEAGGPSLTRHNLYDAFGPRCS
jgi:hypothetical protein